MKCKVTRLIGSMIPHDGNNNIVIFSCFIDTIPQPYSRK